MKYTHPEYMNEEIETVDVMTESPFTVQYHAVRDENGEIELDEFGNPKMKTVIGIDAGKLFF